jgi:sigma-B regulation protein RsbU (phosphoserine phosphatase)
LRNVNRQILESNEQGMFVTMLYGVLDLADNSFSYARAGHVLPILTGPEGNVVEIKRGQGRIMGLFEELPLDERRLLLPDGGTLFLFTDGIDEAADPDGNPFGVRRLQESIANLQPPNAQTLCDCILEKVYQHAGTPDQQDDITMLALKVSSTNKN